MRYVIIGGSAGGISCAESIREIDKKSQITLVTDEVFPLYSRCLLSYLLAGSITEEGLYFKGKDFYKTNGVEPILGVRAEHIDVKARNISLSNSKKIDFDKLLIATGSRSKMLDIPGAKKSGVFALRTVRDARGILETLKDVKTAAVLGGGLIGLKAAYALSKRGVKIKVVVKSGQVLSQIVDQKAAAFIHARIEKEGIEILKGRDAKEIVGRDGVEGVILDNGAKMDCQLVVIGKGVEPNVELAKDSGISVGYGITAGDRLNTSQKDIYTAGDVAETRDIAMQERSLNAIWPCAIEQGKIAGYNMAGKQVNYKGSFGMNSVEFFGLPVISIGITHTKEGYEELVDIDEKNGMYKKVLLKDQVIRGYISLGRIEGSGVYHTLIKNEVNVANIKNMLLDRNFSFAKIAGLVKENKDLFKAEEFKDTIWTY